MVRILSIQFIKSYGWTKKKCDDWLKNANTDNSNYTNEHKRHNYQLVPFIDQAHCESRRLVDSSYGIIIIHDPDNDNCVCEKCGLILCSSNWHEIGLCENGKLRDIDICTKCLNSNMEKFILPKEYYPIENRMIPGTIISQKIALQQYQKDIKDGKVRASK